jgi:hypothetical protein
VSARDGEIEDIVCCREAAVPAQGHIDRARLDIKSFAGRCNGDEVPLLASGIGN